MKRLFILLISLFIIAPCTFVSTDASLISDKTYRALKNKEDKQELKQIKKLLNVHSILANKHDIQGLKLLYSDNYVNSDGFDKETYFKNVQDTWDECKDLTYGIKILDAQINGDYASVSVEESAVGTVFETNDDIVFSGEIHSKSTGIYHFTKIGGKWFISGETLLTDESSLLYGDARFMNIELQSPQQVKAGEMYTASLKIDADENTFIIASIDSDPVTYPTKIPNPPLRTMPKSNILERVINANTDNINEYAVASLAISKTKGATFENYKIYMAGMACIMRRINVVPKNNLIKLEDSKI